MSDRRPLAHAVSAVEGFFDRLKLSYKWRFDRWESLRIVDYLGYGTSASVLLHGRVLDDEPVVGGDASSSWRNLRDNIQRIETDEVPEAMVRLEVGGEYYEVVTDGDGFFRLWVDDPPRPGEGPWHEGAATLMRPAGHDVRATLEYFVPNEQTGFVVVSDLDDTVIRTGATNLVQMLRVVMFNGPASRTPFPGVAAFYRALAAGPDGHPASNPVFYVSSSPWNFYSMFIEFLAHHDIPLGPILLKDFGFSRTKLWKEGHETHKLNHLRELLGLYPHLPFVLIGDSGQRDPEIFSTIVAEAPERIAAVYLRDVTPPERDREVHRLGERAREMGVAWTMTEDTSDAARHAADAGLVSARAAGEVADEVKWERSAVDSAA